MKTLSQHISQVKTLNSLNEFIAESKTLHQNVNIDEKLVINKNFGSNLASLDEIYNFDWVYYKNAYGIYYVDEDRKAFDVFYKYFVQCAKQKITFHQQCKLANKGEYLCAINESEKKIYLFHQHMNLDVESLLYKKYEKFEIIPSSNGMRIHFMEIARKPAVYPLSTKSKFNVNGTNPQYYLIDEDLWGEMKTLYNDLKNR